MRLKLNPTFLALIVLVVISLSVEESFAADRKVLCKYAYDQSLIEANWAKRAQEIIEWDDDDATKERRWELYAKYAERAAHWAQFWGNICK